MLTGNNNIKKLLCLGDSLTYGYGVKRADCWVTLTAKKTGIELVNCGISGDTSCGMLARFQTLAAEHSPDALFVMGGSNDIIYSKTDSIARSCIAAIVQQAQAMGIKPILGIPPRMLYENISDNWSAIADFKELRGIFDEYSRWLRQFAEVFAIPTVDFSEIFYTDSERGLSPDGLHPDKEGHIRMAELLIKKLGEK